MLRLSQPEWLLLLPLIVAGIRVWPALFRTPQRWRWLRLSLLLVLVLALAQPELRLLREGLDVWLIVDRSESASHTVTRHLPEWEAILARDRGAHDRIMAIDYASEAIVRDHAAGVTLPGSRDETRTAQAIRYTLSKADRQRATRLLLLTDGYSTESLRSVAELLRRQNIALDYRIFANDAGSDFRIDTLRLPSKAAPGEAFLVEFTVSGPTDIPVPYELHRNGQLLTKGSTKIETGQARSVIRVIDRVQRPGGQRYSARIIPANDPQPGNNALEQWLAITGGPRILVVTSYSGGSDPLVQALRKQQFEVEVVENPAQLSAGSLQGARTIILNNIPAYQLPADFLGALDFFVREQGGGLLMAGGRQSFAKGGYSGSAIDELLPVSMQLKNDHRKLGMAMAIALDRSGSMTASTGGVTKMDLANTGAARSVELLSPSDMIAVFAVDTQPHTIVPLSVVGGNAAELAEAIRGIRSAGGGIYIEEALKAAMQELTAAPYQTKHLILFADASDSEEPGRTKELLRHFTAEGGTVSVIGLGSESDSDAPLLKEIAALGNGRIFFSQSGENLPALFEQETVAIARSAFIEEPSPVSATGTWMELSAQAIEWPAAVDGYNLSYLRPEATAALTTVGEESAPLVAFWQRGAGRVAAVSFPLGGQFSETVRSWSGYADFIQTLCRWLQGEAMPPGLGLRTRLTGTELSAELFFDPSWEPIFSQTPPRLILAAGEGEPPVEPVWQRTEPGLYRTTHPLTPGQLVRGALQVGAHVLPFGPIQAGKGAEWERNPGQLSELRAIARESGGEERINLATIWEAPRALRYRNITPWILAALLVGLLADTLLSRWSLRNGSRPSSIPRQRRRPSPITSPPQALPQSPTQSPAAPPTAPPPTAELPSASSRRKRFTRARIRR